ncbi:hypothetical protein ACYZFP_02225 [Clostridioides difficile]
MFLEPLRYNELREIFDEEAEKVIQFFIKKSLISQPEAMLGQMPIPVQVPKEHIETWVVQAIGGTPTGAGSYPVDILKAGEFAADVKMMACKMTSSGELANSDSGETSLAQKFTNTGDSLDDAFKNKEYQAIVDGWKDIIFNKLDKVRRDHNINRIYYIFILRADKKFYLCATKVNVDEIYNIEASRAGDSSIFISNLINENFGNAKIYKAKKRLELRLRPKYWVECKCCMDFNLNIVIPPKNIRDLVEKGNLDEYTDYLSGLFKNDN